MRVAIVGSRNYRDLDRVRRYVASLPKGTIVVSGGARGVDKTAERAAKEHGLNVCIYYPNWEKGRGAGLARNKQIVHNCDRLVAFHDGESRGTMFTIEFAAQMSREVIVFPDMPADFVAGEVAK